MREALAAWAVAGLLAGCAFEQQEPTPAPGQLLGTTWSGTKPSFAGQSEYFFGPRDRVVYRARNGLNDGKWRQEGTRVEIELNNRFATMRGQIQGEEIVGEFTNIQGTRDEWRIHRIPKKDAALSAAAQAPIVPPPSGAKPLSSPENPMEGFVGAFSGGSRIGGSTLAVQLRCEMHWKCELTSNGKTDSFHAVTEDNLRQARLSLQFARRNRFDKPDSEEAVALVARARPLLDSDTDIERCLKLSRDGSTLVCKVAREPWQEPVVLLLGLSLAPCVKGGAFCGYVFYPLFKEKSR